MWVRMIYPTALHLLACILFIAPQSGAFETLLNFTVFPVGEGEAVVVECIDRPDNVPITLVNAGSMNARKGQIQLEYFEFLEKKLKSPNRFIKNIILTSSEAKHNNFIVPLMNLLKEDEVKNISFYLGGERSSYVSLDHVFQTSNHVYEFTRQHEVNGTLSSCGHLDAKDKFIDCVKRDTRGPIPKSDQLIPICDTFQASVIAANYGGSDDENKNNLFLKITPYELSSPSVLIGDIGSELEDEDDETRKYDKFLHEAHSHYYTRSSKVPRSLWKGLRSTLLLLPRNGASTTITKNSHFFTDIVQPQYGVISSDISYISGHPRCSVLKTFDKQLSKYSTKKKHLQCHRGAVRDLEDTKEIELSDNLYQTTIVSSDNHSQAQVSFRSIVFTMTQTDLSKPVSNAIYSI